MPSLSDLLWPFVDAVVMVMAILILTRLVGLRSFSKMSGYDFAITVAMGSILASVVVTKSTGSLVGIAALLALFGVQVVISHMRVASKTLAETVDNRPLLIMDGPRILDDNLAAAKMTRDDLMGKLREANVLRLDEVRAVVFEQTGDVSVLHGDREIEEVLLEGVRSRI